MQVWWQSGHLSARSDLGKSLQTVDRQTDDGRRAIALAHWNELKTSKTNNQIKRGQKYADSILCCL